MIYLEKEMKEILTSYYSKTDKFNFLKVNLQDLNKQLQIINSRIKDPLMQKQLLKNDFILMAEKLLIYLNRTLEVSNYEIDELIESSISTYHKKNKDYGNSFKKVADIFGVVSLGVRINDKINRLISLEKNGKVEIKNESVIDTIVDAINYCAMSMEWLDGDNNGHTKF